MGGAGRLFAAQHSWLGEGGDSIFYIFCRYGRRRGRFVQSSPQTASWRGNGAMSRAMSNDGTLADWWQHLTRVDLARAEQVRLEGCPHCGGPLDRSDYPRKPWGKLGEAAGEGVQRVSLCCRRDGCRRRATPPSVRFLGRKVYVGATVIEASVAGGAFVEKGNPAPPRRIAGVPSRTVLRWLFWWRTVFALGSFWLEARSFFARPVNVAELPASLLARFGGAGASAVERLLRFVAPITTESVRASLSMVV